MAALAAAPLPLQAKRSEDRQAERADSTPKLQVELRQQAQGDLAPFYGARNYQPLWFTLEGAPIPAVKSFLQLAETASYDGLGSGALNPAELASALQQAQQEASPAAVARAEILLSQSFASYVRASRRVPPVGMTYEYILLQPQASSTFETLREAAAAPSLNDYITEMRWMHPLYAPLRRTLDSGQIGDEKARQTVLNNLERIRALPADPGRRYVLVDTASARLWMYEDGRPVDSMRVVVGKPDRPTPMISGYLRHAIFNPYWNVPSDMAQNRIAPNVLRRGVAYLKSSGYQVLSDWSSTPDLVDPSTINWQMIAKGEAPLRVRQLPSAGNFMGKVKYEFPNPEGIYLHDTPEKNLLQEDKRQLSGGCIRLEDAERLGRWLFKGALPQVAEGPEQKIELPELVPIYVTYLTAYTEGGQIALGPDPYKRDAAVGAALPQAVAMQSVVQ